MKIHEYQARELLAKFGVPVPPGIMAETPEAAGQAFEKMNKENGVTLGVVKAQVHAGGRGKGGGVKLVRSAQEAVEVSKVMFSKPLVTPQTGPAGVPVKKVLVASGVDIAKEYYLGMAVDRASGSPVLIASNQGGVDIEEVAHKTPDAILREPVNPNVGLTSYQARKVAYQLGFTGKQVNAAAKIMGQLTEMFLKTDASLVEINAEHPEGQVLAIDAKVTFDENALFRHPEIKQLEDPDELTPAEHKAQKFNLSYIQLDGNIGCLVNGAGLAMATMDIIKLHGQEPANFLDIGGSATEEAVTEAFKIILEDKAVKGILVNIFGGIAKCDLIARAIIASAKSIGFKVPLVVRLEGTNVDAARKLLAEATADLPTMQIGTDLTDAARKITSAVLEPVKA
jgi:succinyl-CoA synthetase beta subunit